MGYRVAMTGTTPAPRAYLLGAELRRARNESGLGLREIARQLNLSHSVIVRWESGDRAPTTESVSAYMACLRATSAERERIIEMAREAAEEPVNSVSVGATGAAEQRAALIQLERAAVEIIDVSPVVFPGLVQTDEYMRAIIGRGMPPAEIDALVTLRLGRQHVITRDRAPVKYTAILLESVLYQPIGSHAILADQLRWILKLGARDNVDIRVIPTSAGWTPAHAGSFLLLKFAAADPVVLLEHYRSSAFLRHAGDVHEYTSAREDLWHVVLSAAESAALIADAINRMEMT